MVPRRSLAAVPRRWHCYYIIWDVFFGRITVFVAAEGGRCYCYYCYYILLLFISISYAAETCYCTAVVLRRHGGDGGAAAVPVWFHGCHGSVAAIMAVPRRSHYGLVQPAVAMRTF